MDLDALRYGAFSKLGEAVTDWDQMAQKLALLMKDAQDNLKAKADKARWAGVNAGVTREFVDKTAAEFTDAHIQANSIAKILSDTRSELISYSTQVNDAITRAAAQNLSVIDTGDGTFIVTGNTRPDYASDPSGKTSTTDQKAAIAFRDEIQGILSKATESDTSAAQVLRLLVDQAKYGFADASYKDRDGAARAVTAAQELAKKAKMPADMTLDDITEFNRVMNKYNSDPLFAEQFAREVGPKGMLQFWAELSHAHAGARDSELQTMKTLQNNVSLTLATASFSDSNSMQEWKKGLIAERNTNFLASKAISPIGAQGSQIISSLMRQGQYDTEFLDEYRKELFKADKPAGDLSTDDLYPAGYDVIFGDGTGNDPIEGLFDGLSHNPEAAVHAFADKSDLDHMISNARYTDRGTSLGHALEAAVTGRIYGDASSVAPPHTEAQVQIMVNVMEAVAQPDKGADLVSSSGMGDSFGNMAASYMPEISRALNGPSSAAVFVTNSDSPDGFADSVPEVVRFLSAVSADPSGRAGIILGESLYTAGLADSHIADPSLFDGPRQQVLVDIGRNAGIIEGIVAHSVADAEVQEAVKDEASYNANLKAKGDVAKTWVNVGMTFIKVPEELGGAAMGGVVGGGLATIAGGVIDHIVGPPESGARDQALYTSAHEFYNSRNSADRQTVWSVEEAINRHHAQLQVDAVRDDVGKAVNDGFNDASELLSRSKERPNG
ncbi:hypothetical protein [Streptomyces sp. bgisy153]|uniref:hypothetical protein n=1 Tax=Streptomyces sp. bgisy153 TaxID=3413793 RepID=UPI003D73A7CA